MKAAIIGGGISGLSIAQMLKAAGCEVRVFEKASAPGGLVKCSHVNGVLFHMTGGHVFNSRRQDVLDWFWPFFERDAEFFKAVRHAVVALGDQTVDYPIENHLYQMKPEMRKAIISDLLEINRTGYGAPANFDEFLRRRFGKTLYEAYFHPYNAKIWQRSLEDVPLAWLQGKLPMPTIPEILEANITQEKEMNMVHSTFWYPLHNGSQHLADTLAKGLDIRYNAQITCIRRDSGKWIVDGEPYDKVVYTCNVRDLPQILQGGPDIASLAKAIGELEFHGTTAVLCEIDKNPYSWIYMPDTAHESHRIICTGNFSPNNDHSERTTATIEFSREMTMEDIQTNLARIPFHPTYLAHHYEACTYPVQTSQTKDTIDRLKAVLHPSGLYLHGRFAEWEYYNMDAAIGAGLDLCRKTAFLS